MTSRLLATLHETSEWLAALSLLSGLVLVCAVLVVSAVLHAGYLAVRWRVRCWRVGRDLEASERESRRARALDGLVDEKRRASW